VNVWAARTYRCPATGRPLELRVYGERTLPLDPGRREAIEALGLPAEELERDVVSGVLVEEQSGVFYPVIDGIPVLLDFDNPAYGLFEARCPAQRGDWAALTRPSGAPRPGELLSQRTFTREWLTVEDDRLTFTYTHAEREAFIAMEIGWPPPESPSESYRVLDVGCGFGLEGVLLARLTQRPVFAIDLNVSLLRAGQRFSGEPLANLAVASAFAPPFEPESFDLVYSHGTLHHTYDTRRAFESVLGFARPDGMIAVWVYALEDAQRGNPRRRLAYVTELAVRPWIARLPAPVQSLVVNALALDHYRKYRRRGLQREHWRYANSVHSMRDRWTPPYAHRHSFHEVISWFVENGLGYELLDPVAYREQFRRSLIGIAIRGRRAGAPVLTSGRAA